MLLLVVYVVLALGVSFLCSIAEAVILSVTSAHIEILEQQRKPAGSLLRNLKDDINKPLAAILTLNTIAHTVGAVGAGAQATAVFGDASVGVASVVLTLLILVLSEIIPKTLGAHYWRPLSVPTAYGLKFLIFALYPFVKLSEKLMGGLTEGPALRGFNRREFAAMAELSAREGQLGHHESMVLKSLLRLHKTRVTDAMTPRTVIFSLAETTTVETFFHKYDQVRFSRIPIYRDNPDHIIGFVLRSDLLLAQARGNSEKDMSSYCRDIKALLNTVSLTHAFDEMLRQRTQIMQVVDEYGTVQGIITMEDILETLLGLEIVDESDKDVDMRKLARTLWRRRARTLGVKEQD